MLEEISFVIRCGEKRTNTLKILKDCRVLLCFFASVDEISGYMWMMFDLSIFVYIFIMISNLKTILLVELNRNNLEI